MHANRGRQETHHWICWWWQCSHSVWGGDYHCRVYWVTCCQADQTGFRKECTLLQYHWYFVTNKIWSWLTLWWECSLDCTNTCWDWLLVNMYCRSEIFDSRSIGDQFSWPAGQPLELWLWRIDIKSNILFHSWCSWCVLHGGAQEQVSHHCRKDCPGYRIFSNTLPFILSWFHRKKLMLNKSQAIPSLL